MKTLLSSLLLAGAVTASGFAAPTNPEKKPATQVDMSRQLATYITYPASLPRSANGAIVMVQFKVGEDNRLRKLAVLSPDDKLNADLVRQLTGRKVAVSSPDPDKVHTVRIHFQTD